MKPSQIVLRMRESIEYPDRDFGSGKDDPRSFVFKVSLLVKLFTDLFALGKDETKTEGKEDEESSGFGKVAKAAIATAVGAFALLKSNEAEGSVKPSDFAEIKPPEKTEKDRDAVQTQLTQPAPVVGEPPKERKLEFDATKVTDSAIKTANDGVKTKPVDPHVPKPLPDTGSEPVRKTVKDAAVAPVQQAQQAKKEEPQQTGSLSSLITKAANEIGVDPETLKTFVMLESSGNIKARSKTGALGLTQFTSIAWEEAANKGGRAYGIISPIPKDIKGTDADPRFDPYKNLIAGAILIREGTKYLTKHGITPYVTALYTYHNVGPTTTLAVYGKGEHTEASRKAIANQGAGFTEANYLSKTQQRVELAQASVQGSPPVMASVVTSGAAPVQTAAAPAVQIKPATAVATQGASESKPIQLAAATPEAAPAQRSNASAASGGGSGAPNKPQQFYKDRNGNLVAAA